MSPTIVVAVRKALMSALAPVVHAAPTMADIPVGFQFPTGNEVPREAIWTQNASLSFSSAALRQGRNFLNEESRFDLMIRATGPDVTPEEIAQRAVDIAAVVVDWINDHKNADLWPAGTAPAGLQWLAIEGDGDQVEYPAESGFGAGIRLPISYRARLT